MQQSYFHYLTNQVQLKIETELSINPIEHLAAETFTSRIDDLSSRQFHAFYLQYTRHPEAIHQEPQFFRLFKQRYSLQGIPNTTLDEWERDKPEIIRQLMDNPFEGYLRFFHQRTFVFAESSREKSMTSFFTKLLHTLRPDEYSALDNPIRKLLGLKKESFFYSYCIINTAYQQFISNNSPFLQQLRHQLNDMDSAGVLEEPLLSSYKLLDMIFWWKANRS